MEKERLYKSKNKIKDIERYKYNKKMNPGT